ERQHRWLGQQRARLRHRDVFRVGAEEATRLAEYLVADVELGDRRACARHHTRELDAEPGPARSPQAGDEPPDARVGGTGMGVRLAPGRRMYADEALVAPRNGTVDPRDPEALGRAVSALDDGSHRRPPGSGLVERLLEVADQVVDVLDSDGQPHQGRI